MDRAEFERRVAELVEEFDPAKDEAIAELRHRFDDVEWYGWITGSRAHLKISIIETLFVQYVADEAVRFGLASARESVVTNDLTGVFEGLDLAQAQSNRWTTSTRDLWEMLTRAEQTHFENAECALSSAACLRITGELDGVLEDILGR